MAERKWVADDSIYVELRDRRTRIRHIAVLKRCQRRWLESINVGVEQARVRDPIAVAEYEALDFAIAILESRSTDEIRSDEAPLIVRAFREEPDRG